TADPSAALAVPAEGERALHEVARLARGGLDVAPRVERLAMPSLQRGLVVEGVHLADAAVHEELDHPAHLRPVMQPAIQLGPGTERLAIGPGEQALLDQHLREGNPAQAAAQPPEEVASRGVVSHEIRPHGGSYFTNKNSLLLNRSRPRLTRP